MVVLQILRENAVRPLDYKLSTYRQQKVLKITPFQ